uniref:Uncharacterized protein n=1 Tax=Aegilops tauschii subsp. strangulata TaxID=200361 RepID=A0A452Z2F1_AEGTS
MQMSFWFMELMWRAKGESYLFFCLLNWPDSSNHLFGTAQGAGTAILTLLGGFHPQTQSLWLTDMAHHHLAIAFIFLIAGHILLICSVVTLIVLSF